MGNTIPPVGVCPQLERVTSDHFREDCFPPNGVPDGFRQWVTEHVTDSWVPDWRSYVPSFVGGTSWAPAAPSSVPSSASRLSWDDETVYSAQGVDRLKIEHPSGAIKIIGADTDHISVKTRKISGGGNCYTETRKDGGSFVIDSSHQTLWGENDCNIDMEIIVPRALAVEGEIGFGRLDLSGVDGDLSINLGSGSIYATVSAKNTHLELGQGVVNLAWDHVYDGGAIDLQAGAATVTLSFPQGTVLNPQVETGLTQYSNALPTSRNANFDVTGKMGIGSLTFKQR